MRANARQWPYAILPCKAAQWKVRLISGKPDTSRGVRPVWRGAFGNLPQECGKALGAYPTVYSARPDSLSTFAGEPSQNVGKSFIKSYCAVCLEGAVIVLACIIFSLFASSPPVVDPNAAAVTQVWAYIGELLFNMLVLVGSVRMSDRIIREMMGL